MNQTINLATEQFKQDLYFLINNCQLPISNAYFVFQIIFKELEDAYNQTLEEEQKLQLEQLEKQTDLIEKKTKENVTE